MITNRRRPPSRPGLDLRAERRGFALLGVILILALITTAIAISLDAATESTQNAGRIRAAEMVKGGLDHGLNQAIEELQSQDPAALASRNFDIFDGTGAPDLFLGEFAYPPNGPYRNQYAVRIGMRSGQVTRPPVGEDVRTSAGQIYEVQVSVEARGSGASPSMERVSVGVLIPRRSAY